MAFTTILQRFTYSTLCFILFFSTSIHIVTAEEGAQEPADQTGSSIVITIDEPTVGEELNDDVITVAGTIDNSNATIKLFLNGDPIDSEVVITNDRWVSTLGQLAEGQHAVIAEATDNFNDQVYTSNFVFFTVDRTPPDILITNLSDGDFTNLTVIEGITEPNLPVKVILNSVEVSAETVYSDSNGFWSFDLIGIISEGTFLISAIATDLAGNEGYSSSINFTFDQTRPYIPPNVFPRANMTKVSLDTVIKLNIVDNYVLSKDDLMAIPLEVIKKGSNERISGTFSFNQKTNEMIEIIFKPDFQLETNQKYYVYTNPALIDRAKNVVHPRNWSFTTTSNEGSKNPHGNYSSNVNTCITCHRTHTASNPILKEPSEELTSLIDPEQAFTSYCMACHDGTVAALPENWGEASSHHFQLKTTEGKVVSQSCGSCHNPHLTWSERNPNSHQDHFTFEHTIDLDGVDEPFLADSKEQLCESCHDTDSLTRKLDERVKYNIFSYRNWNSSSYELTEEKDSYGQASDYTLCLRCHNENYEQEYQNIVDIKTYYQNEGSAHFITADRVKDGSLLNGHLPCADCHNSHGSENVKIISGKIGHNNQSQFIFTKEDWVANEGWTPSMEREFCVTCHNNVTELYGITVALKEIDENDEVISGHEANSIDSCVSCHGGYSQSFIEAVHAPQKYVGS